jgi:hypothetical protein
MILLKNHVKLLLNCRIDTKILVCIAVNKTANVIANRFTNSLIFPFKYILMYGEEQLKA